MDMRIVVLLLTIMLIFSVVGCGAQIQPEPSSNPSSEPTTVPTTEPNAESIEMNPDWLTDPVEYLSYEEFFAEERTLTTINGNTWRSDEKGKLYGLYSDEYGLYIKPHGHDTSRKNRLHSVPNTENFQEYANTSYLPTDGRYVYFVRNHNEIVRIELLTGDVGVLYSGGEIMDHPVVFGEGVMYFAAREQDAVIIYRLYIPERKLDVLYDQIPKDSPKNPWFSLWAPDTNWGKIGWKMLNPEMVLRVNEVLAYPNNPYMNMEW